MSIGEFLKKKRIEKFMKIKQLAEISSISDGQISRLENDEQKPGLETIISLSNALGFTLAVSYYYLLLSGEALHLPYLIYCTISFMRFRI